MGDRKAREDLGIYISDLREKKGYALEQVCEGLCTAQQLSRYERGEKAVSKLLQDALLERLGAGAEDYEHYLNYKDYDHWEMRQRILYRIQRGKTEGAKQLLADYHSRYVGDAAGSRKVADRLEYQFYLSMLAQVRGQEGADREELHTLLETAVGLTMPGLWEKPLAGRVFSFKELNLVLEAEQVREGGSRPEHYREVISYIEASGADALGLAKIYPKAVYLLCRCSVPGDGLPEETLLELCNHGVEILREGNRMYYLWELLDLREHYLGRILGKAGEEEAGREEREDGEDGKERMQEGLACLRRENAAWKKALENVYAQYQVPRETSSYCYLYMEKGVFCINDVIRIRRRMLGMSRKELWEGICDKKTLERLENRKSNPHRWEVEELFRRLGLAGTLTRTELITESQEARHLMTRLGQYVNNREAEKAEAILAQVKNMVSVDMKWNRQTLMRQEVNIQEELQKINRETYCRRMQEALELTLPFQAFLQEGEKHLSHEEQACIQNLMQGMDKEREEFRICLERFEEMYRPVAEGELLGTMSMVYGLVMGYVASELGNLGEYDRSDWYNDKKIEEDLYSRRLTSIADGLYCRWWNHEQRKKRGIPTDRELDGEEELTDCIWFCRLGRQTHDESFLEEKLRQLSEKKQMSEDI